MPVCPKCEFHGQDEESCERCGVIYSRMHTIFDARPASLADLAKNAPPSVKPKEPPSISHVAIPMPSRPPLRAVPSMVASPDAATELATSPFRGAPPSRSEVTMVPILPPPPEATSRVPLLLGLLVVCFVSWGLLKLREARQDRNGSGEVQVVEDADYYDLAVGSVVSDTQMQFRRITDVEAAKKWREDIFSRERRLRVELIEAPLTPAHRDALVGALDDVVSFLKNEVEPALAGVAPAGTPAPTDDVAIVIAKPGSAVPVAPAAGATDQTALKHANQLLANIPH